MELIIINKNKIKIMLSSEDMKKYDLDTNDLGFSFSKARGALKKILSDVNEKTDFESDTESNRIFIQLYPSVEGGCEMFVTRIDLLSYDSFEKEDIVMPAYKEKEQGVIPVRSQRKLLGLKRATLTYCFESIDWVICACRELFKRKFLGESALYRDKEGRYYLMILQELSEDMNGSPSAFLSEFGELESTELSQLYINENGYCICEANAVELLSKL